MKINSTIGKFLLLVLFPITTAFGWGAQGHKLIGKLSVNLLPKEMSAFTKWQEYISEHSVDADNRKKDDPTEGPKHYIDIDFYKEFLNGHMIENKDSLVSIYGDSVVTSKGLLPWATLETVNNLTNAFKEKNRDKVLIYSADLSHYVADGHQPMHTVLNYNGQLTDQKGVHGRYEIHMVDAHLKDIENAYQQINVNVVNDPLNYIFNYITDANSVNNILLDADNYAFKYAGSREGPEYYRLMWFKTGYITEVQFDKAEEAVASLLYTAWVNGGKPNINDLK